MRGQSLGWGDGGLSNRPESQESPHPHPKFPEGKYTASRALLSASSPTFSFQSKNASAPHLPPDTSYTAKWRVQSCQFQLDDQWGRQEDQATHQPILLS